MTATACHRRIFLFGISGSLNGRRRKIDGCLSVLIFSVRVNVLPEGCPPRIGLKRVLDYNMALQCSAKDTNESVRSVSINREARL